MDTARVLDGIGVSTLRLIRTTETARWRTNAPDSCLSIEKYYEKMLEFANAYKDSGMGMQVIIWQLMRIVPSNKTYSLDPVKTTDGKNKPSTPICKGNRGMVGVTSSGDVVPRPGAFVHRRAHRFRYHQMFIL